MFPTDSIALQLTQPNNCLKLASIRGKSKSVTSVRLWDWLYFWLCSNQMLITKVLFNVFKKWVLVNRFIV
ncbi:hypothetical protein EPC69_02630 [Helicobacter pylori]|nr:hypothetical protein EPC70_04095 [Helicobacter pylori]KAA6509577.1 hypothetical protein EPC81_04625 [Helicobacter pylori]KAA6516251.1 hypothetical protein EPC69_02630 [Helicobacter pylori]MUU54267.1 hypothetical protein [Helicobacter pylori]